MLTEYEARREARIARNRAILLELVGSLPAHREMLAAGSPAPPTKRAAKKRKAPSVPEEEQRRSGRIRNLPAPIYTTFERDEDLGDRVARRRGDATTTPRSKPTAKKPSKPAAPPAVGSIKTLDARITRCAAEYLGAKIAPPPGSGALKEAVIRELAPVSNPRFSKYSGIQEWRNCVCLFVNVGDKHGNSYDNVFTHAGGRIAWFAQPTQDEETPVVARILATADARFDAVQDATAPEGMRSRPEEEPTRRPDDDAKKAKKKDA